MSAATQAAAAEQQQQKSNEQIERFVPVGTASLVDDAPGWSGGSPALTQASAAADHDDGQHQTGVVMEHGPICWKCRGSGLGNAAKKRRRKNAASNNESNNKEIVKDVAVQPQQQPQEEESSSPQNRKECSVCQGKGHLPPKMQEVEALKYRPGEITRVRACPPGWKSYGPLPYALQRAEKDKDGDVNSKHVSFNEEQAVQLVKLAETTKKEVAVILEEDIICEREFKKDTLLGQQQARETTAISIQQKPPFRLKEPLPCWLPRRGEQLCNLVGSWRFLQRVASHRWTTDDLVTSYMAGRFISSLSLSKHQQQNNDSTDSSNETSSKGLRYLDLGCGNGSVLQMTTWQVLAKQLQSTRDHDDDDLLAATNTNTLPLTFCMGIEARSEAVQLARRSIAYNVLGDKNDRHHPLPLADVQVHHGDFRSFLESGKYDASFDLVTGTPPYFRVDFTVAADGNMDETAMGSNLPGRASAQGDDGSERRTVRRAVINQGGMPSCKQSAPARCEFRGGVEAYCQAAATAMHSQSIFCVCENWLNDDRVYQGAIQAGLVVMEVLPVKGRTGKPSPLFAVYAMRKESYFEGSTTPATTKILDCLVVRDDQGNWTKEYQKVLHAMSIPVVEK